MSNRFETNDGKLICRQVVTHTIRLAKGGWQLTYDCEFTGPDDFYFGDQEEMGLGVRLATPLIEKKGGQIRNSAGQVSAKSTWGQPAIWCDYSGEIAGKWAGITIMANGKTPRMPWWHNRNYGLMVANQFGKKAMKHGGEKPIQSEVRHFPATLLHRAHSRARKCGGSRRVPQGAHEIISRITRPWTSVNRKSRLA